METFRDMLWNVKNFLVANPSETVIMTLRPEDIGDVPAGTPGDSPETIEQLRGQEILANITIEIHRQDPSDMMSFRDVLYGNSATAGSLTFPDTLGEARGKCIFVVRNFSPLIASIPYLNYRITPAIDNQPME